MCLLSACSRRRQCWSAGCGSLGFHSQHEQGGLHAHRLPDSHGWKQPIWHLQGRRRGAAHSRRRFACTIHPCGFVNIFFNIFFSISSTVYTTKELKLAVLQIRAPIIQVKFKSCTVYFFQQSSFQPNHYFILYQQNKSKKFRQLLVSWIKSSGFTRTVVLSSSHAYQRDDQQLQGYSSVLTVAMSCSVPRPHLTNLLVCPSTPLRYLMTPSLLRGNAEALKELDWTEMERSAAYPGLSDNDAELRLSIPGGGITKGLYTDR